MGSFGGKPSSTHLSIWMREHHVTSAWLAIKTCQPRWLIDSIRVGRTKAHPSVISDIAYVLGLSAKQMRFLMRPARRQPNRRTRIYKEQ